MAETEQSYQPSSPTTPKTATAEGFFAKTGREAVVVNADRAIIPAVPQALAINKPGESALRQAEPASSLTSAQAETAQSSDSGIIDVEAELVEDDEQLIFQLNSMLSNPGQYTQSQVNEAMRKAYGGATLEVIRGRNPKMAEAIERAERYRDQQLHNLARIFNEAIPGSNLAAPETQVTALAPAPDQAPAVADDATKIVDGESVLPFPEDVLDVTGEDIQQIERTSNDALDVTVKDPKTGQEKKITFTQVMAATCFILADLAFFRGSNTYMLAEGLLNGASEGIMKPLMARLGFEVPQSSLDRDRSYELFLNEVPTEKLVHILEEFPKGGVEMFRFLSNLRENERQALVKGQRFGGSYGKHQLTSEQVSIVFDKLTPEQANALGITRPPSETKT